MNSLEVYEELDRCYIKEEAEEIEHISFDDGSNKWDSVPKRITFEKDSAKCGEVMVACEGTFTFVCSLCLQTFGELWSFGSHIRDEHMQFEFTTAAIKKEKDLDPMCASIEAVKEETKIDFAGDDAYVIRLEPRTEDAIQINSGSDIFNERNQAIERLVSPSKMCIGGKIVPTNEKVNEANVSTLRDFTCADCGRIYKSKGSLKWHMKNAHGNEFEAHSVNEAIGKEEPTISTSLPLTCKNCDQTFDDSAALRAHVPMHTKRRNYVCPYCPKTFGSTYNRKVHINRHTGERPYKCTYCPKGFADGANLQMHIRTHLKIMKYTCDYCDKRFVQSSEKKVHERTHTGEKPFECKECGKQFISQVKLKDHDRRHKNIKNYKCEVCDKAFYNLGSLKNHRRAHTGERPFHCNICDQNFISRGSWRSHQQMHSNKKKERYVCDICGKELSRGGIYLHRKLHDEKPK